jgi:hypothetical protein
MLFFVPNQIHNEANGMKCELDSEPEVPEGKWFKRLPGMIVCGEGELVKTFLKTGQDPTTADVDYADTTKRLPSLSLNIA